MRRIVPILVLALVAAACSGNGSQSTSVTVSIPAPTTIPDTPTTAAQAPSTTRAEPVASQAGSYETAACAFEVPEGYSPRCGYLTVPENRNEPEGSTIRLHVAVFPAASDAPAADPVVYLDGGPGGETLETAAFVFEDNFRPFLEDRDVVLFDQRGVGLSEPALTCPESRELEIELLDDDIAPDAYLELELEALQDCRERLLSDGVDLASYNSAANAADVADLREALGYEDWNLLGVSYGTRLALTVLRDDPTGVRSVILDSTYPPQRSLAETPASMRRAYDALFAACDRDDACAEKYPNLEARVFALADRLNAEPITVTVRDLDDGTPYDALIDGDELLWLIFRGLYSEEIIPLLPRMVDEVESGNNTTAGLLAANAFIQGEFISTGMYASVQCHDEVPFSTLEQLAAAVAPYPEFANLFVASFAGSAGPALCDVWQSGFGGAVENQPVASDVPTLIMAGEFDPITPPAWGEAAAETLTNSYYFEFPSIGHGASFSGECPQSVAKAFLREPTSEPDASCIDTVAPVAFVPDPLQTAAVNLVPFESTQIGGTMVGVVPDDWEEAGQGVWIRGADAIDQTAVLQNIAPGTDADQIAGLFLSTFAPGQEIETETITDGERIWTHWPALDIDGYLGDLAATVDGTFVLVVLVLSTAAERDALIDEVFLPVLSAAAPG